MKNTQKGARPESSTSLGPESVGFSAADCKSSSRVRNYFLFSIITKTMTSYWERGRKSPRHTDLEFGTARDAVRYNNLFRERKESERGTCSFYSQVLAFWNTKLQLSNRQTTYDDELCWTRAGSFTLHTTHLFTSFVDRQITMGGPIKHKALINVDMGEGFGNWVCGPDTELLPFIDHANVACGFHASWVFDILLNIWKKREKKSRIPANDFSQWSLNHDGNSPQL